MILSREELSEGQRAPFGYGFAWYDWTREVRVAYVVPFNWIAAFARFCWREFLYGFRGEDSLTKVERQAAVLVRRAYKQGWADGSYAMGHALRGGRGDRAAFVSVAAAAARSRANRAANLDQTTP